MSGPHSPYAAALGLTVGDAGARIVVSMPSTTATAGRPGFLHGGAISALLDHAGWATLLGALEPGARIEPVTIAIDFMRGGLPQESHAAARIVRLGRRIANVHAFAWQDDEAKPIATANMKFLVDRSAPGSAYT